MAGAPTGAVPAGSDFAGPPPRSSATPPESPRSWALSSTLAPTNSPTLLPPLLTARCPALSAAAPSLWSSPTSARGTLIRRQRPNLHHRGRLPNVNQDLAFCSAQACRNALVMRSKGHHSVLPCRPGVNGDPLAAVEHFHFPSDLSHPHFFPRMRPRHRAPAPLPVDVRVAGHLPQLTIDVQIAGTSVHRLHAELFVTPTPLHLFSR